MAEQNTLYIAMLTDVGAAQQAKAIASGTPWNITHMGVGDGIHPNKTAAEHAAKARLAAFNRSTAGVRLEMPGRSDLFAERMINAQGFKDGLDGEYLVDSREQVFTQSGWSTTIECNAGKKGKAKVKGKKPEKTLKIVQL